jgi:hypothetical protein
MIPRYDRNAMYESRKLDFDLARMAGRYRIECDTWNDGSR